MISIIICSKYSDISSKLKHNIEKTIGVPFELIIIDNSNNKYSIFEAYNIGVAKAKFEILCFMHEDILYHSSDWGKQVLNELSNPEIGIIGLAGSYYLLNIPSPWYKAKPFVKNLIQYRGKDRAPKIYTMKEKRAEVVCVDGFWFCSKRNIFQDIRFDTETYNGFHFYDLDICTQIRNHGYKAIITSEISVEHFSGGNLNTQWIEDSVRFYNKWNTCYPIQVNCWNKRRSFGEVRAFRDLLWLAKKNKISTSLKREINKIAQKELGTFRTMVAKVLLLLKRKK
jgi:hypothetical protein